MVLGKIGTPLPAGWPRGGHGTRSLLLSQAGLSLLLHVDQPTDAERAAHASGRVLAAVALLTKHAFALLFQIDGITSGWEYVVYAPAQDLAGAQALAESPPGAQWQFEIGLADSESSELLGRRRGLLSAEFRRMLQPLLERMVGNAGDFSWTLHQTELDSIGRRHPTDEDMLRSAEPITETRAIEDVRDILSE